MAPSATLTASRPSTQIRAVERAAFKQLNRFMVPLVRSRLAKYMACPATGYFLLLRTTGRKSGLPRFTPLNYAIMGGRVCLLAGFGEGTHWLANLRENPRVWVKLPGREVEGTAEVVRGRRAARRMAVAVARNAGFALLFEDPRCIAMSDAQLARVLDGRPVVAIRADDGPVEAGPYDPGGWGWVLAFGLPAAVIAALWWLLKTVRR